MQVNIEKPMGIRFARGNDGAPYVLKSDPRIGNTDDRVEVTLCNKSGHSLTTCFAPHLVVSNACH
jgi:hypothetical protein